MVKYSLQILICSLFFGASIVKAQSQYEHKAVRKLTVFPLAVSKQFLSPAEEAWWQLREALTESKRFMVASKSFMLQKDVFQARSALSPADVIILGKLLDADALVTTYLEDSILRMKVYEGEFGRILWEHEFQLHSSLPVSSQLPAASKRLIQDFLASVPYQGFVVRDELKPSLVYNEDGKKLFQADIGVSSGLDVGDQVQVVRIMTDSLRPIFTSPLSPEVFVEGKIVKKTGEIVTVQIERVTDVKDILQGSLLRAPKELARMKELYSLHQGQVKVGAELVSPDMVDVRRQQDEKRPLVASLAFIANMAIFLLLAF